MVVQLQLPDSTPVWQNFKHNPEQDGSLQLDYLPYMHTFFLLFCFVTLVSYPKYSKSSFKLQWSTTSKQEMI